MAFYVAKGRASLSLGTLADASESPEIQSRAAVPAKSLLYNWAMPEAVFSEMRDYIGFSDGDAANLLALKPFVTPRFPRIVRRFYDEILRHPGAAAVLSGPEQVLRLHDQLSEWLESLFCGVYDVAYCRQRSEIGRAHVRVGLPQHYMFTAMDIVRQELERTVQEANPPDAAGKLGSLRKLLTLELGIMLETYKESYSEQVRRIERSTLHERLTRAEHLAQIGQLAASLAHEIKNPLTAISGAIQVMRDCLASDDSRQPILGEVLRQISRLDGTVRDLLIYARPTAPRMQPCDLSAVIQRILTVLREEPQMQRTRVQWAIAGPVPLIEADEHQLEQLLMNLILNAAQASPQGGVVRVSAGARDERVWLEIEDNGCGMSEEVMRRALEPFFTTKARGTGLGLPICQQIVAAHGGTISIHSAPGQGTLVVVELPGQKIESQPGRMDADPRTDH